MCLYPRLIKNRKYTVNNKNGGNIPPINDDRVKYVAVGCERCIECRKRKKREWQVRLLEDIKTNTNGKFITLTFSDNSIKEIYDYIKKNFKETYKGYDLDNKIATVAVHLWRERWRKKFKTSPRHWLITELGHTGTENIHLHGIIWTNENIVYTNTLEDTWQYGYVWKGNKKNGKIENYVSGRTINYICKYVHKMDFDHKTYKPIVLTSPGIGGNYIKTLAAKQNKYKSEGETNCTYKTSTGHKIALPIYLRNKIYSEDEREKLWLEQLNKETRYVMGEKIDIHKGDEIYIEILKHYRRYNTEMGYGSNELSYDQEEYEREKRIIQQKTRIHKARMKEKRKPRTPE